MHNLLITSAGRRGVLVQLFQRELQRVHPRAKVFAADVLPDLSSACQLADGSFRVPRADDETYVPTLTEICRNNDIELIVPTIDPELIVLAEHAGHLTQHGGATPVISGPDLIRACRDKRRTHELFATLGLRTPAIIQPQDGDLPYPLFVKPFDGSAGVNTHVLRSRSDLAPGLLADTSLIYMEYLSPEEHDEYTVDMYFDRHGNLKCLVPRLRIETRASEVSKGRTAWIPALQPLREKMARVDSARGCLTVQVFVNRRSDELYGIEINPRFGGGYPLSYEAGANYPGWVLREYLHGESVDWFDGWERDLTMLRYDDHVLVRQASLVAHE